LCLHQPVRHKQAPVSLEEALAGRTRTALRIPCCWKEARSHKQDISHMQAAARATLPPSCATGYFPMVFHTALQVRLRSRSTHSARCMRHVAPLTSRASSSSNTSRACCSAASSSSSSANVTGSRCLQEQQRHMFVDVMERMTRSHCMGHTHVAVCRVQGGNTVMSMGASCCQDSLKTQ
jgi:hypothetical protein